MTPFSSLNLIVLVEMAIAELDLYHDNLTHTVSASENKQDYKVLNLFESYPRHLAADFL